MNILKLNIKMLAWQLEKDFCIKILYNSNKLHLNENQIRKKTLWEFKFR